MDWHPASITTNTGGRFQLVITGLGKNGRPADVTLVRGALTKIGSYTDGDPFGDATAELTFPALTPFDDLDAPDLGAWLCEGAAVDIWWRPARPADRPGYHPTEDSWSARRVLDPMTEQMDIITPTAARSLTGDYLHPWRRKVWEGYIASIKASANEQGFGLPVTCQGAVFQLDRYRAAPFYPPDPFTMEALIAGQFARHRRPQLRTKSLIICFPDDWQKKIPKYQAYGNTPITPHGRPGDLWSGLSTRNTGSWTPALTGFVQDLLTVMITPRHTGARAGNQWTVNHFRYRQELPGGRGRDGKPLFRGGRRSTGRQPVLMVRNRFAPPDFSLWLGEPGLAADLDRDSTQAVDVIYGDGIDTDGQTWRNATISDDGQRTSYAPLAFDRAAYPYLKKRRSMDVMPLEGYTKYGNGFSFEDGVSIADQQLAINMTPGWQGTITIKTDPSPDLSRWELHAGMVMVLKGFMGTGADGMRFHVASAQHNPEDGTVTLTVDTRFRDLLTLEESLQRTRDPLTPVKMLQVGLASTQVEDVQAPWDYSAGSGFAPRKAKNFFKLKPNAEAFPYLDSTRKYPPQSHPEFYTKVDASAPNSKGRWTQHPIQILCSAKDTIARTEFICVDFFGRPKRIPFHLSIYYVNGIRPWAMPHLNGSYSAYQLLAFERVNPVTGTLVHTHLWPDPSFVVGWGNNVPTLASPNGVMDRPGFWPGREATPGGRPSGAAPTGRFVDDSAWDFDLTAQRGFFKANNPPGKRPDDTDISLYAMIYAEAGEPVYFIGRLFRQNPGVT